MTIGNLNTVDFNDLVSCFLESFENYFVKMPADPAYYRQRWQLAKVNLEYSYGMFDNEKLVGFVLHAIDTRNGMITAYNTGTGVIPAYRGRRIIHKIYEHAIPVLKHAGVGMCSLEVITNNEVAIAVYQHIGFQKIKRFKCFRGELKPTYSQLVRVEELPFDKIPWPDLPNRDYYSWENHEASIKNGPLKCFQVWFNDKPESYFIIDITNGYVAQLDLLHEHEAGWDRLFKGISQVATHIRINNVDERFTEKISQLNKAGLENHIDQYEMQMRL